MHRTYAPTTDDIDNFRFAASTRLSSLLRGELELGADFDGDGEGDDEFPLSA